jgi:hypothetical protein
MFTTRCNFELAPFVGWRRRYSLNWAAVAFRTAVQAADELSAYLRRERGTGGRPSGGRRWRAGGDLTAFLAVKLSTF